MSVRSRLPLIAYGAGFLAMLGAAAAIAIATLGSSRSMALLWVSSGLSAVAVVAAVAAVTLPRR